MSLSLYFWWKIQLANNVDPDQMPHYVASDLGLHCLPTLYGFPGKYECTPILYCHFVQRKTAFMTSCLLPCLTTLPKTGLLYLFIFKTGFSPL